MYLSFFLLFLAIIIGDQTQRISCFDFELIQPKIERFSNNDEELRIKFTAFNQNFTIDLIRNYFISNNYHESPENDYETNKHCHYKGNVNVKQSQSSSFAAISFCDNQLNGIFILNDVEYHLEQQKESKKVKIFINNPLTINTYHCGFNNDNNTTMITSTAISSKRSRRALNVKNQQLFQQQRYVEMVLVNDLKLYGKYKEKLPFLFERNVQIANIVNALYSPFNISIVLVGVIVWTKRNEIILSNNSSETLNNFLKYRRDKLMNEIPNDNAQLITASPFENGIVGKALKQTMCTYEYSGGVNYDYHESISLIATTIAHELGHNFGMEHDNDGCHCKANNCIMGPSSSFPHPRHWSSCSISQLEESLQHGLDYCLMNKPNVVFRPSCGNGIIDSGEDCDCGLPEFCTNKCCNATTCKLMSHAKCSGGVCCDRTTCQLIAKHSKFICRQSKSICDPAETCDGHSENCPANQFVTDGTECNEGYAYCFDGKCETRENRCHLLWGNESQVSGYRCYQNNANANSSGNCGYDKKTKTFIGCQRKDDIICGRLHCTNRNNNGKLTLKYGPEGSTVISQKFESHRDSITCFSAMIDLGLNEDDIGLVPNGAKCGLNQMCVDQKCVQVKEYQNSHCDRHPDDDKCQSSQQQSSTNILLIFTYLFFILSPILLLFWFLFIHKKPLKFPKNFFGQKAFIAKDYNNRRPKMNPINRNISVPIETELTIKPVRPAPPPPPFIPKTNTTDTNNSNPLMNGGITKTTNNNHRISTNTPNSNQITRPKRSPPKTPPPPPPPSRSSSSAKVSISNSHTVKDLVAAFEKQ